MGFQLIRLGQLITTSHIHRLRELIKPGTSHQEAAPAGNDDVQVVQSSSEQAQGTTMNQIQYNPGSSVQHVQQPVGQGQN